jgi:REP element-mobilizing transposase RayT
MKLAEKLKSNSSRWMKTKADFLKDSEWQIDYSVYSTGESEIPRLKKYIENQKEHHSNYEFSGRNKSFIEIHINEPLRAT